MKCKHKEPWRYTTKDFLMCLKCKKKIRKLNTNDRERIKFAKELASQNTVKENKEEKQC